MSRPLVLLAALLDGEDAAARAALRALGEPFARVPGTHLVRVQVLQPPPRRWRGRPRPYLLLAAEHDGPPEPWLAAAGRELDTVLAHCAFWPGAGDPAEVARWALERRVDVGFSVVATDATVEEVGVALHRQAEVRRLIAEERRP
ncbi:MAG: hypothetical protein ABI950_09445 [Solirubrobacteraceae bacterium]